MGERFGYYGNNQKLTRSLWVHAVSLGEATAALPLIKLLLERYPRSTIVVTTMTPTGYEKIKNSFKNQVTLLYLPYDYPGAIKRFLRHTNPRVAILMETEIWPNLLYYTAQNAIAIVIVNGRLSLKSYLGYRRWRVFISPILDCIDIVMVQSNLDRERFLGIGMDSSKIVITGNMKFDLEIEDRIYNQALALKHILGSARKIWIAASTHRGEEEKVLIAAREVLKSYNSSLLILAPRHPERFDEVYKLCENNDFKVVSYSNLTDYHIGIQIVLVDVIGELPLFYGVSDVAFVGGSLIPWGGHNLLEPAALAKPIISGKYLSAFLNVSQLMEENNALITVDNEEELAARVLTLFGKDELREQFGAAALDIIEKHRGVTEKIINIIDGYVIG